MNFLSPAEVASACCNTGKVKSTMSIVKLLCWVFWPGSILDSSNLATVVGAGWPAEWADSGVNKFSLAPSFPSA